MEQFITIPNIYLRTETHRSWLQPKIIQFFMYAPKYTFIAGKTYAIELESAIHLRYFEWKFQGVGFTEFNQTKGIVQVKFGIVQTCEVLEGQLLFALSFRKTDEWDVYDPGYDQFVYYNN